MLKDEDVLFDWSKPICLNFTHMAIMNQLEPFNIGISSNEGIEGDIYVYNKLSEDLQLEEYYPSKTSELLAKFHWKFSFQVVFRRRRDA